MTAPEPDAGGLPPATGSSSGMTSQRLARLALPLALALVLLSALRWVLADLVTPFGWALLAIGAWVSAILAAVAILMLRRAPEGETPRSAAPALLIVLGGLIAMYGPWAELDLQARWKLLGGLRGQTLAWVRAERPTPGDHGRVKLPAAFRPASATGGEIRVGRTEHDTLAVLFFTYRGVPSGWAGFLNAPSGKAPVSFAGDSLLHVRSMAPGWYFVAAR